MYKIPQLLKAMIEHNASDLFVTAFAPPSLKVDGQVTSIGEKKLDARASKVLCYSLMSEQQRKQLEETKECNFAIHPKSLGRFRVNVFHQQNKVGMVIRFIKTHIPTFKQLGLPASLCDIIMKKRGLVIFVGGTNTGKSTTMASLIDYRNQNTQNHIITIEDPIEYIHEHKQSIITQREVGTDTDSFENALVNAMRQSPDVIQIGEIRTKDTMKSALLFAQTGHLCVATLHTNNTYQAIERIFSFFPAEQHQQLSMDLAMNLQAIVSQRLIPQKDTSGRVPALEILINTPTISDLIKESRIDDIADTIERSGQHNMQTFDQALITLYNEGKISKEQALQNAESENNVRLKLKLQENGVQMLENDKLSLEEEF